MNDLPNRREFIESLASAATLVALPKAASAMPRRRPNVIYAFSDEHRWHSMSFAEMPDVITPNMKRLASQGTAFNNCISNYPVCSPHRAMLMTGRWPYQQRMADRNPGMIDNSLHLSPEQMTLGKAFKAAGYATGYVGKWHLGGTRAEPFGFDLSLIWTKTNNHWNSIYYPKDAPPVKTKGYNATLMTNQALEFIERHKAEPFFLMISWNPPHSRFTDPPEGKKALYPKGSLPYRPNMRPAQTPPRARRKIPRDPWKVYQGYHAHVSAIDEELGRVMKKLDELNLANDTILVYASDHGSMLGSHGVGGKRQPYEESIKTPFIVRWPRVVAAGQTIKSLFGTIDIMPSLCAIAGIPIPRTCSGQDFSPTMRGEKGPEPESQFIMHISKRHASGGQRHPAPLFRGVTTERYTYALYPGRPWCLFDNQNDPYQLRNLMEDPAHKNVCERMRSMLAQWLKKAEDPFVMHT